MAKIKALIPSGGKQVVVFSLLAILLVLVYIFAFYNPMTGRLAALRKQTAQAQAQMAALENTQRRYATAVRNHDLAYTHASNVLSQFPRESDLPAVVETLNDFARIHKAKTELIDYSQVSWTPGLGQMQITAVFSGPFMALAPTLIDIQRSFPSARVEEVRISTVLASEANTDASNTARQAAKLREALGISDWVSVASQPTGKPLQPDRMEARVVLTMWLANQKQTEANTAMELLGSRSQWFLQREPTPQLPKHDPFQPTARAVELVALAELAEKYKDTRVTGIVRKGQDFIAVVEVNGKSQRIQAGNKLGEATVTKVNSEGLTLELMGRRIQIAMGGVKK